MKVLLVRPVIPSGLMLNVVPPLGIGYLASALRDAGHTPLILDCTQQKTDYDRFRDRILDTRPDMIAYSANSNDVPHICEDMPWIRKRMPEVKIVIGGPHPSSVPEQFFDHFPEADYGLRGESEHSFPLLVSAVENNNEVKNIPGLIYRQNGAAASNSPIYEEDLDAISFPAWDLLRPERYPASPQGIYFRRLPIAPIITTRGCPCPCEFCSGRTVHGARIRRRSIENIIQEIQLLRRSHGIREIHILDDNFTHGQEFAASFCESMIRNKMNMTWCCPNGVRLDSLDEELLKLMKRAGCYSISAGIESGDQKILDSMNKGITLDLIKEKVALIKKAGLISAGFFILGFPGETRETIEKTIQFAITLPLDRASFFNFLPLPGTPAARRIIQDNEIKELEFGKLHYMFTPYVPEGLTPDTLKSLQRRAFIKFFLRRRIIAGLLLSIRTPRQVQYIVKRMFAYLK